MSDQALIAPHAICFVGPLPPPTHGMANVNRQMVDRLSKSSLVHVIDVGPGAAINRVKRVVIRLARVIRAPFFMMYARMTGARVFYGSVDDGIGGLFTATFAVIARCLFSRLYLHHHSFHYLTKSSRLMRLVVWCAGPRCRHIHLCDRMAAEFRVHYGCEGQTLVVPNAITTPDTTVALGRSRGLVIGLLSNLMFEKGIIEFVHLLEVSRAEGLDIRGVLAGPAWSGAAERFLKDAVARSAGYLTWVGPVHGEAKSRFFAEIDLFVFPTRYSSEAYPLVLVEALVRGCAVITRDQGCIAELGHLRSVTVVDAADDFVSVALDRLRTETDRRIEGRREIAVQEGESLNAANRLAQERFAKALLQDFDP